MNRMTTLFLLSLPLAAALASCGGHDAAAARAELPPVRARIVAAALRDVPLTVELQGEVTALRTAQLATRVMATVRSVHVDSGDRVGAGQLLLTLDPATSDGGLAQARGALAQAEAALALAERNYGRYQALAERDAVAQVELDMARMQLEQARGAVEQAAGAVAAAGSIASDTRITAPFAGRIGRRMVEVGELAAPGRPLLSVESEGARRLALSIPESVVSAGGLSVGVPVTVRIDSRPDLGTLAGTVVVMSPGSGTRSRAFEAEVELPAADLATGAIGRARVVTGARRSVFLPAEAVLRHGGLELVAVLDEAGRTGTRVVTTGRDDGAGSVEILSGLAGGERVVSGLGALPPAGSPVEEVG